MLCPSFPKGMEAGESGNKSDLITKSELYKREYLGGEDHRDDVGKWTIFIRCRNSEQTKEGKGRKKDKKTESAQFEQEKEN